MTMAGRTRRAAPLAGSRGPWRLPALGAIAALAACTGVAQAQAQPAASPAQAQPAASPAKKELVAKLLQLQRPAIEGLARSIVEQPAVMMMQQAGAVLQQRVAPERRESAAKDIRAEAQKYSAETVPTLRDQALKLAPTTIGPVLEARFSEAELKQLIAWLESPLNRKFQQVAPELDRSLREKLVAEGRPTVEAKLRNLEAAIRAVLESAVAGGAAATPAAPASPAASGAGR